MEADNPALLAIVRAISDGAAVDWDSASDGASASFKQALAELRVIADVADLNRSLSGQTEQTSVVSGPVPHEPDAPALARWGHLHLLEHVASGSFGDVYRAWDPAIDREVALKLLRPRPHLDTGADETIEEGRLLARVRHPNVVTIYGAARIDGRVGIWMEFVQGRTLAAVVKQDGPLDVTKLARIGSDLCDAVAAVHDAGLLHRDIKAQNVMLAEDGRVVLMDLGAGRGLDEQRGDLAGTPLYLAPEILSGEGPTIRSDVYSLGVLLHLLASGRFRPRDDLPASRRPDGAWHAAPPPGVALTPALERVVGRAIALDPGSRFASARELGSALDKLTASPKRRAWRYVALSGIAAAALLVSALGRWWPPPPTNALSARVMPLTALQGTETFPSLSPDGTQVAFTWGGEKDDDFHVYLNTIGSTDTRRLTSNLAADFGPSWSPDGQSIAFLGIRSKADDSGIYVASAVGGSQRRIGNLPVAAGIGWSPDGRYIAAGRGGRWPPAKGDETGIFLQPVAGGEPTLLTSMHEPAYDVSPAFSPDGRHLAFSSCKATWDCAVTIVDLDSTLHVAGQARRLAHVPAGIINTLAWTHDSREVIYDTQGASWSLMHLWRVTADGSRPPEHLDSAGYGASQPTIASGRDRLAYSVLTLVGGIYRFVPGAAPTPVLSWGSGGAEASFAPDGRRVTFSSMRSVDGRSIWVANADGSQARPLTPSRPDQYQGSPSWSPDGTRIAFDDRAPDGNWHIWTINADGGSPQQLTAPSDNQAGPSWSRDSRWVYYTAWRNEGERRIYRIPANGGTAEQLTREDSWLGRESPDGQSLLYRKGQEEDAPLMMTPLAGGAAARLVAGCGLGRGFAVGATHIYYLCTTDPPPIRLFGWITDRTQALHRLNPATGDDRVIGTVDHASGSTTLAASPNEQIVLYDRVESKADLMLIENFR